MSRVLAIATAPRAATAHWKVEQISWSEVCAWEPRTGERDGPGYVLGKFQKTPVDHSGKKCTAYHRNREAVVSRSVIPLDADHLTPATRDALLAALRATGWPALVHSTASSTPAAPRLRILLLPDRDLTPDEYRRAVRYLIVLLGPDAFDPTCEQPERFMYMPTTPAEGEFYTEVVAGVPLGVDALLLDAALEGPEETSEEPKAPSLPVSTPPARPVPEDVVRSRVAWTLRKLDELAALLEGERIDWSGEPEGVGWDRGVLYAATRLVEAANSGAGYTLDAAEADFMAHAPASMNGYDRDHKWAEAAKHVGDRPLRYDAPEDDFERAPGATSDDSVDEGAAGFTREVEREVRKLRVRQEAARLVRLEALGDQPPVDAGTLAELLARPVDARWRVEGLLPAGGRMLLPAQRKTGKTTCVGNLARALLTGEPFLGRFEVTKLDGRFVVLNYEVTGEQFSRWMDDIGVPRERMYVVNLRGRRNLLADDDGRAELVERIRQHDGEALAVDPFGRAYTGRNQNDAAEVTPFLVRLDEVAERAGCNELVLTAHAGWDGERTRGSSALEDWPDAIVTMTRDPDTGQRFLRAEGRDVELAEDRLLYDADTRRLSLSGAGSRRAAKATASYAETRTRILGLLAAHPDGLSGRELANALNRKDRDFTTVRNGLVEAGQVVCATRVGRGGGSLYILNPENLPNVPEPTDSVGSEPTEPPFMGGGSGSGRFPGQHTEGADPDLPGQP